MRLIMMGTGPFAVPTFRGLVRSEHDVLALVTRPTAAVRSRATPPRNPMREAAEALGVAVVAPADVNDEPTRRQLTQWRPDLLVVCDFGQLLAAETLDTARLGGVNLHGSLLPKYRGAAPVAWAILRGETETGVTVIHMTARLDAGPCLVQRRTPIGADETSVELEERLAQLGPAAVAEAIGMLERWDGRSELGYPQDPRQVVLAPRLRKEQGQVDWSRSARQIRDQVRALKPWPGTFTCLPQGVGPPLRLILDRVAVVDTGDRAAAAGTVVLADSRRLVVATGDGCVSLERVQPAGRRVMEIAEFLRGHAVGPGQQFAAAR